MRHSITIFLLIFACLNGWSQENTEPDFRWGNSSFYNLNVGDSIVCNGTGLELLEITNHFNKIKIGKDTTWLKVSRRSLPSGLSNLRVYVADNVNVKNLTDDNEVHGLLTKDALICVSFNDKNMLDPLRYIFPVSYNDGFFWRGEEDSYIFSYLGKDNLAGSGGRYRSYEGIGIDLHDARGVEKHWIVAIENSEVVWIESENQGQTDQEACVLLKSESNPDIYYLYNHLYAKNIEVRAGQKLFRGELIGTGWGDEKWGHLQFVVLRSDSVPTYEKRFTNVVNFFPQFYELYFHQSFSLNKFFTKGKIEFGKEAPVNQNQKNILAYEMYSGKGWDMGRWNKTDKVEWIGEGEKGNARLRKTLFANSKAQSTNPKNYYDYRISVKNGVYRIRAQVGDLRLPSWQRIEFEGTDAGTFKQAAGDYIWTSERVVKITDYSINVRIYLDTESNKVAGLSEIVFQKAY